MDANIIVRYSSAGSNALLYRLAKLMFVSGVPLNSFISYYEPAYFNTSDVVYQLNKNRAKRSLSPSTINIDFRAHNR